MSKEKPQLHELLAVETSKNKVFNDILAEARDTFSKKDHLFKGHLTTNTPLVENIEGSAPFLESTEETQVSETIESKLDYVFKHFTQTFNVYAQKEKANQEAKADVTINGEVLIKDAPATMLLGLESKLNKIREMIVAIKTTDNTRAWTITNNKGIWQSTPEERGITKKVPRQKVVFQPTEHQPGQYESYVEDVIVGKKVVIHYTGLISSAEKAKILDRVDTLAAACKRARQRANKQVVDTSFKPGKDIANYILGKTQIADSED